MIEGRTPVVAIALALTVTAACATSTKNPPPPQVQSSVTSTEQGGMREDQIVATMTVEKVDVAKRLVTLRGPDGAVETLRVGDEVRNLGQVHRGDHVIVTYYQAVAYQVLPPGSAMPSLEGVEGAGRAKPGEKPAGVAARIIKMVAKVAKLDRANRTAVLTGPRGKSVTVDVRNPAVFDKVKVGDTVEIEFREAVAIDVHAAPK
jgi:hypothetical protein